MSSLGLPALGSFETPLTIGEVTELIKGTLENTFSDVVVSGEISNFKAHTSGHFYFSLKDSDALISAVMFKGANQRVKFVPKDGLKVIAFGRVTVYPPRGNYQLMITRMEPEGLGSLQLAFEQLKARLEAEGLFKQERKRVLPKFPKVVGIVTSPTGAAIRDILHVMTRRFSGVQVKLYPVRVQGETAAKEIAEGIYHLNKFFPEIDVMIVGRGGGSLEDLWCFNEEIVARAIFKSTIPIISAVGHEVDFTIADFVADYRAPTPSAAAEIVTADRSQVMQHLASLINRMKRSLRGLEMLQMKCDELHSKMIHLISRKIQKDNQKLSQLSQRIQALSPAVRVQRAHQRLALLVQGLKHVSKKMTEKRIQRLAEYTTKLQLLNPRAIMERGYSIVRHEKSKKVIRKAADLQMGDKLLIEFHKGRITARV